MEEKVNELATLIEEDKVDEVDKFLNSNRNLQNNFNRLFLQHSNRSHKRALHTFNIPPKEKPLLHFAVREKSKKVVEYLLSQDFVDKTICNSRGENIYHIICRIRRSKLFSIIERIVPHHLLYEYSRYGRNAFHIACEKNNVFIVKRVYEILQTLQVDLTSIKNDAMTFALRNNDIEVIKYVLSIDGIQLNDKTLLRAIRSSTFDIVVYLLNVYLCRSIPSHLHNQFHIFQFLNYPLNHNNNNMNVNNCYLELVEENFTKILNS